MAKKEKQTNVQMSVAIDIGNGYIKAMNQKEEKVHFPTVIKENMELNILGNQSDERITIEGQKFFIGNLALVKRGKRRWENNATIHEDTEKYIAACCYLLSEKESTSVEVELSLGLPYSYYLKFEQGKALKERTEGKIYKVEADTEKEIIIRKVHVFPQGVGAYFANLYGINGEALEGAENYVKSVSIDIGYRTVDVVAFEILDNHFELIEENSFSLEESGLYNAMNRIAEKAGKEFEITAHEVDYAIRNKNSKIATLYGEIDLSKLEEEEYARLADEIVTEINQKLSGHLSKYQHVFVTGGGALSLYEFMKKRWAYLKLQEDAAFCNARGYLAMARKKE